MALFPPSHRYIPLGGGGGDGYAYEAGGTVSTRYVGFLWHLELVWGGGGGEQMFIL